MRTTEPRTTTHTPLSLDSFYSHHSHGHLKDLLVDNFVTPNTPLSPSYILHQENTFFLKAS